MTVPDVLRDQARHCQALGSAFMHRLLAGLAEHWPEDGPLHPVIAGFTGDIGPKGASIPLRLASGLHALVLSGRDEALAAVYPPAEVATDELARQALDAMQRNAAFLTGWMRSPPQTNEVRRSAMLIAATHWIMAQVTPRRLWLSELGASGGLNLMFDRYALAMPQGRLGPDDSPLVLRPDWTGPDVPRVDFRVQDRRGVDLCPLDPRDPDHALRLRAYLWPDQPERLDLTQRAIAMNTATVDEGDAIDWLENRLMRQGKGTLHLVFHTIAWQYFPPDRQARGQRLIEEAGAAATEETPLAWLSCEADGDARGAALRVRLWPEDRQVSLGRADFHGRWIDWAPRDIPVRDQKFAPRP